MPKHGLFLFQKRLFQWPSGTVLPGFDHMLMHIIGLDLDFVTEVHLVKVPSSNLRELLKYL